MPDKSFLTWPFFEDRHRILAEAIDAWCRTHLSADHGDVDAACRDLVAKLGRDGWLMHTAIDPDAPGALDVRILCLIRETLARHDGLADFAFAMQGLGAGAISLFGNAAQRHWLKRTRTGAAIAAFALSEAKSGSDVAGMEMTATRDGDDYILSGEKTWISNGGIADVYVVFARTGEAPGAKGISAFIVPSDLPGFSVVERIAVIAPHPLARISFDHARIPVSAMIGAPGEGFKIAMATLDVDAAALLVYRAAWTKDMGAQRVTREAAMAKLFATEQAQDVIDKAVQIHGGDGVRRGHIVERLYREIRALRIYEGASEVQKVIIARQTLSGG
jgi:acyl-CoA dehydrogenase